MSSPPTPQFCAYCGAMLRAQSKFCPKCGCAQSGYAGVAGTGLLVADHLLKQRYRVQRRVGVGGMGAVYQAEDTLFKSALRAIKEMSQSGLTPQDLQEAITAFEQEANLLAGLVHPHLPRIYDHFEEAGRWYLVMDFIGGETLETRLEHAPAGALPLEEVLEIGIKLATVLGYLHTRQPPIIFRDLKPANVMLTPEDDLYLIDFGIARLFKSGQAKDTARLGTPGYAAPEQFGKAQTTAQSDIYSLGALLHQLLSGVDPSTNQPLLWDFKPLGASLPAGPTQLILRMVNVRMAERPASMQEVRQELQRIVGQQASGSGVLAFAPSASLPFAPQQWFNEGLAHHQAGRYVAALAAYERAIQLDPTYSSAWNNKGWALNELKRYQEALVACERAIQLDPTYSFAWNNKGLALNELKRYQEGLAACERAVQLDPTNAFAWNNKGWALNELKRYQEGLAACELAIQLDPTHAYAWNNKGNALECLKRPQEALAAFERATQLDPNYVSAWNGKGWALGELKRYQEGLAACELAIQLDPTYAYAWNNKGVVLKILKRPQEALAAFERATQLDPTNALAWNNKGWALIHLKRYEEGLVACERATQLDPTHVSAWNNKGWTLGELKRYAEALAAFERVIQLDPTNVYTWSGKGWALNALKRYEEGLVACERAIQLDPNYVLAQVYRGYALNNLGREKESEQAYQRARALGWQG